MKRAAAIEIEHECARLVALYANLNDAGRWDDLAALFSEDGRMARPAAPDDWIVGRAAILAAFKARPARASRHLCTNIMVDVVNEDEARGECALALFTGAAEWPKVGFFHDRFIRTGDGWRFSERRGGMTF